MNKLQRKTYTKPILNSEAFVPNEYVAACAPENGITEYWIACDGKSGDGRDHNAEGCKRPTAYEVAVNQQGYIQYIYEAENELGWGGGNATNITVNGSPSSSTPLSDPNGTYDLTWNTRVGWVTMYHTGQLKLSTAIKVNMS